VWEDGYSYQLFLEGDPKARAVHKLDVSLLQLWDLDDREPAVRRAGMRVEAANRAERHDQLQQYFGHTRVPNEDFAAVERVFSREQLAAWRPDLLERLPTASSYFTGTTVESTQDYIPELEPQRRARNFSLAVDYAEQKQEERNYSAEDYAEVNDWFVLGEGTYSYDTAKKFLRVQANGELRRLVDAASCNGRLDETLGRLVVDAIHFSSTTGYTLDLGEENLILPQQGDAILADARYPRDIRIAHRLVDVLQKVKEHELLTFQERIDLLNGRKYVCAVNFLAAYCGIEERLRLPGAPEELGGQWKTVLDMLRAIPKRNDLLAQTQLYVMQ